MQDIMSIYCHTMLSFLPIVFINNINRTYVENSMFSLLDRLNNVHYVIAEVLRTFSENAVRGIHCMSKEQKPANLVVKSYSSDIPEHKEMPWVKYSNRTMTLCPRCQNLAEDAKYNTTAKMRIAEKTIQIICEHHTMCSMSSTLCHNRPAVAHDTRKQDKPNLDDMSIHPISP